MCSQSDKTPRLTINHPNQIKTRPKAAAVGGVILASAAAKKKMNVVAMRARLLKEILEKRQKQERKYLQQLDKHNKPL